MFDFDLPTVDQNDNWKKTGGLLPAGKYHVRLDGAKDVTSKTKGTPGTELIFTVLAGPNAGHEVKETLWGGDADALKQRLVTFGYSLGVLTKEGKTFKKVEGVYGFPDCLGNDCVIEIHHEEYTNDKGKKGTAARVTFNGCWPTNHADVKTVAKAPKESVKTVPAKEKKVDTSDL